MTRDDENEKHRDPDAEESADNSKPAESEEFERRAEEPVLRKVLAERIGTGPAPVFFLGVLTIIAAGVVLKAVGHLLIPLIVAFFLSYLLWPMVVRLRAWRVPGGLAVAAAALSVLIVLGLVGVLIVKSITTISAPETRQKYEKRLTRLTSQLRKDFPAMEKLTGKETVNKLIKEASAAGIEALGGFFTFLSNVGLILIYLSFILAGRLGAEDRIQRAFPRDAETIRAALLNIDHQVNRYLATKTLINFGFGVLVYVVCLLLGIDFPILWGFVAFATTFIPAVGSVVAPVAPILLAFLQYPDESWRPITLTVVLIVLSVGIFNAVEPKLMGDQLGLSPLVVMSALLFFGWMWGIWGAVLSVPLAAVIKIVCENFESTKPIAIMME